MRNVVNVIVGPMNFLGVNPLKEDSFFTCYFRILLVVASFVYQSYVVVLFSLHSSRGDLYSLVVPLPYGLIAVIAVTIIISTRQCKSGLRRVLRSIDESVFVYPDEDDVHPQYPGLLDEEKCARLHTLVIVFAASGFVFAIVSPFLGYLLVGRLRTYMFPQWVPWKTDSRFAYLLTITLQIPVVVSLSATYYMILTYFVFVLVEFLRQFVKLRYAIKTLEERSRRQLTMVQDGGGEQRRSLTDAPELTSEEYDRVFRSNLVECIRHHQKLFQLFKIFKTYYEIVFSLELTLVTLSFALLLYCLVVEPDLERSLSLIGASWLRISNLFFRCFVGEKFSEMQEGIGSTLFHEAGWQNQSSKNRKLVHIFHSLTQRPLTLKGFGIFDSSYYVFSRILRLSYSYLNLIQASRQ